MTILTAELVLYYGEEVELRSGSVGRALTNEVEAASVTRAIRDMRTMFVWVVCMTIKLVDRYSDGIPILLQIETYDCIKNNKLRHNRCPKTPFKDVWMSQLEPLRYHRIINML